MAKIEMPGVYKQDSSDKKKPWEQEEKKKSPLESITGIFSGESEGTSSSRKMGFSRGGIVPSPDGRTYAKKKR